MLRDAKEAAAAALREARVMEEGERRVDAVLNRQAELEWHAPGLGAKVVAGSAIDPPVELLDVAALRASMRASKGLQYSPGLQRASAPSHATPPPATAPPAAETPAPVDTQHAPLPPQPTNAAVATTPEGAPVTRSPSPPAAAEPSAAREPAPPEASPPVPPPIPPPLVLVTKHLRSLSKFEMISPKSPMIS
jgi:hypothetical protein